MNDQSQPSDAVPRLIDWANARDEIRAMLMTSTRAKPNAVVDVFSDYDIILVLRDIHPFVENKRWLQTFGQVLVSYWDPIHASSVPGIDQTSSVIQYANGLKIDFTLWPVELMQHIATHKTLPADLDDGYVVLVDKDKITVGMPPPTYTIYIPVKPTAQAFATWVEEFFSDPPYVAKCLWRDELMPAKWCLDYDMKHVYLRRMLEWRVECDHNWSLPAGNLGKGLKKYLPVDIWAELEGTYAEAGIKENWAALFKTMALFRRVAIEVADCLGYDYSHDLDAGVTAYVKKMKKMDG